MAVKDLPRKTGIGLLILALYCPDDETEDSDVLECCTLTMQLLEMYIRPKGIVAANTLTIIIPKQETPSAGDWLEL